MVKFPVFCIFCVAFAVILSSFVGIKSTFTAVMDWADSNFFTPTSLLDSEKSDFCARIISLFMLGIRIQ